MSELEDLKWRRKMCDAFIRTLLNESDPRAPAALELYKAQLAELDGRIAKLESERRKALGIPEPEPVVVGVKPAILFGQTEGV